MTDLERRKRIHEICEGDKEYQALKSEYDAAQKRFTALTDRLPGKLRNLLWCFPGTGYLLHHKMLNLICEKMVFPDEE